ncbi:enterobactin exporter EntS [compost metagenome]
MNALIPQLVPKDQLMKVNGVNSSISSLMMFLAPAAGGVILSISTIEIAFFIDVITAIIGIGMMCIIVVPVHAKLEKVQKSNVQDIKEGF